MKTLRKVVFAMAKTIVELLNAKHVPTSRDFANRYNPYLAAHAR